MIKKFMMLAAVAAMACTSYSCSSKSTADNANADSTEEVAAAPAREINKGMVKLEDDNFIRPDQAVAYPTVLDFNATWCIPCRKLTPAMEAAAKEYEGKIEVYAVDIEVNPETAKAFDIQSVPTVVLISPDGKVETHVGLQDFQGDVAADATPEQLQEAIQAGLFRMIDGITK